MPQYLENAKRMYIERMKEIMDGAIKHNGRIKMVDIGCGPATCGVALAESLKENKDCVTPLSLEYIGVDVSEAMRIKAEEEMQAVMEKSQRGKETNKRGKEEMRQTNKDSNISWLFVASIDDAAERLASKDSALVIFNFSHFFACIDVETAETLASKIKNMMTTNADNDYMVVVQQSTDDDKLRSYEVFSKVFLSK